MRPRFHTELLLSSGHFPQAFVSSTTNERTHEGHVIGHPFAYRQYEGLKNWGHSRRPSSEVVPASETVSPATVPPRKGAVRLPLLQTNDILCMCQCRDRGCVVIAGGPVLWYCPGSTRSNGLETCFYRPEPRLCTQNTATTFATTTFATLLVHQIAGKLGYRRIDAISGQGFRVTKPGQGGTQWPGRKATHRALRW